MDAFKATAKLRSGQNLFIFSGLYFLLTFLIYPHIFNRVYLSLGDEWCHLYSQSTFIQSSLRQGIFPFWNPLVLCGTPSNLDSVSFYTLPTLLLSFLDVNTAWNLKVFFFTFATGFFTFRLLAHQMGLSRGPSFFGGVLMMAFAVEASPDHIALALMPLILNISMRWIRGRRLYQAFFLTLGLALYFLHANLQLVFYFYAFLYFFCISESFNISRASRTAFLFLMPALFCAFHILPALELLSESNRQMVREHLRLLMPFDLIGIFYKNFFLSSLTPDLNFLPGRIFHEVLSLLAGRDRLVMVPAPYSGIFPALLALLTFFQTQKTHLQKYLGSAVLFILIYLMLNPIFSLIFSHVPVINMLWSVSRIHHVYYFSIVLLAAMTMDRLFLANPPVLWNREKLDRTCLGLFAVILSLIVLKIILLLALQFFEPQIMAALTRTLLPWIQTQSHYEASSEFYSERIKQGILFLNGWSSPGNTHFLFPSLLLVSGIFLIKRRLEGRLSQPKFLVLGLFIFGVDFAIHFLPAPSFKPQDLKPLAQVASFIHAQPGLFRVMALQPDSDPKNPRLVDKRSSDTRTVIMRPETNSLYGWSTPEGYRALFPRRYAQFIELLTGEPPRGWLAGEYEQMDDALADLLNVKYVITSKSKKRSNTKDPIVYEDHSYKVFKNEGALERAFLVHQIQIQNNEEAVYQGLAHKDFDFSKTALVENSAKTPGNYRVGSASPGNNVQMTKYSSNEIYLETQTKDGAYLVLTDSYFDAWKAKLNGKEIPIDRANYVFRGLEIPAGQNKIEFRFEPKSYVRGLGISIISLALGIFLVGKFGGQSY